MNFTKKTFCKVWILNRKHFRRVEFYKSGILQGWGGFTRAKFYKGLILQDGNFTKRNFTMGEVYKEWILQRKHITGVEFYKENI